MTMYKHSNKDLKDTLQTATEIICDEAFKPHDMCPNFSTLKVYARFISTSNDIYKNKKGANSLFKCQDHRKYFTNLSTTLKRLKLPPVPSFQLEHSLFL